MMSVLSGNSTGLHFELLERIWERHREIQVVFRIIVGTTVEKIVETSVGTAGHGNDGRRIIPDSRIQRTIGSLRGDAYKKDELGRLTSIERQFQHPLVVDHLADA